MTFTLAVALTGNQEYYRPTSVLKTLTRIRRSGRSGLPFHQSGHPMQKRYPAMDGGRAGRGEVSQRWHYYHRQQSRVDFLWYGRVLNIKIVAGGGDSNGSYTAVYAMATAPTRRGSNYRFYVSGAEPTELPFSVDYAASGTGTITMGPYSPAGRCQGW